MSKKHTRAALTQDRVKELLEYDCGTRQLTWRARPVIGHPQTNGFNKRYAGKLAGTLNKAGYRYVKVGELLYMDTHLIWKWMTGDTPNQVLFHNGDRRDTRWENLYDRRSGERRGVLRINRLKWGVAGIYQCLNGKWQARYERKGLAKRHLGTFETMEEAVAARQEAVRAFEQLAA